MKRTLLSLSLALSGLVLLGAVSTARAQVTPTDPVVGTATGKFIRYTLDPLQRSANWKSADEGNVVGTGTNSLSWGTPINGGTTQNVLTFTGASPSFVLPLGQSGVIGTLHYENAETDNNITGAKLNVALHITKPKTDGGSTKTAQFDLDVLTTDGPDQITGLWLPKRGEVSRYVGKDGLTYQLTLTGWGDPTGGQLGSTGEDLVWRMAEKSSGEITLFGRVDVVPEPASMALLLPGLAPLGLVARRRRKSV